MANVLIIDDDPDFAEATSLQLMAAGHSVQIISEGRTALASCLAAERTFVPDVILVDLYMPGIDGIQVIAALRQAGVKTPIIAVSGGGSLRFAKMLEVAKFLGANASLAKPLALPEILALIAKFAPQERAA